MRMAVAVILLGLTSLAHAEMKVGVIDLAQLLREAPQARALRESLEADLEQRKRMLAREETAFTQKQEDFDRNVQTLSPERREQMERELLAAQRELIRKRRQFEEELQARRMEGLREIDRNVSRVIRDLAEREGFDLILSEGVLYASQRMDITARVIQELQGKAR
ncbi:OmpH family outer membrane protein [Candidatus Macondimonas diazotrophica]|nr:OmpH family outer membrane protein [Candidatus Macondimonas diazotrophica]NCU00913.1 OmpH family outer membrane protein [Candidatus Macondimonas diazotrophica]